MRVDRVRLLGLLAAIAAAATVAFVVVNLAAPRVEPAHLLTYRVGNDDRQVVIAIARGHCDKVVDARAQESPRSVVVTVLVERPRGSCTADIVFEDIAIVLVSPLGDREVSGHDGVALPPARG